MITKLLPVEIDTEYFKGIVALMEVLPLPYHPNPLFAMSAWISQAQHLGMITPEEHRSLRWALAAKGYITCMGVKINNVSVN